MILIQLQVKHFKSEFRTNAGSVRKIYAQNVEEQECNFGMKSLNCAQFVCFPKDFRYVQGN